MTDPQRAPPLHDVAPGPRTELTLRAVVTGLVVAAFIGAAYPFVVLKLGFGPNMSVMSAFLGYIVVNLVVAPITRRKATRWEYNIVQTAGTSASSGAFMVILLAAFDLLASKPSTGSHLTLSGWQIFLWLSVAGCLGVLLAVPLRKHYIDEEKLTFADGTAAGETLMVLDAEGPEAKVGVRALLVGGVVSGLLTWFRDGMGHVLGALSKWGIPEALYFGKWGKAMHVGFNWSLLSVATGLLVGVRVALSMGLGMVLSFYVAPGILHARGLIPDETFRGTLSWVMWPAVGVMVSGGVTALALKWRLVLKTFQQLRMKDVQSTDFPMSVVGGGAAVLAVLLIAIQKISLGMPIYLSAIAIVIAAPLMLVGIRVLGETNWAPISAMANLVQVLFAAIAPGSATVNMVTSGMSGTIASNGEHLMQDYKAGKILGSSNRALTTMQLMAVSVGAGALAWIYPKLRWLYGIGPTRYGLDPALAGNNAPGLVSPASVRWAGFADVLSHGIKALPPYCLHAFAIAVVVGALLTIFETKSHWVPSAASVGIGMLIEAHYVLPIVAGGVISWAWGKWWPKSEARVSMPLASGIIVGEALIALVITVLLITKVLS